MTDTETKPAPDAPPQHSGRVRSIAATLVFAIAVALLPVGLVAYWGHRTVTNTEAYLATVQPLAYNEEVQDALATTITAKIQEQIDPEALVEQIFAGLIEKLPALKALVPVVAGAIDSLIAQVVDRLVRSDQFKELWDVANIAAQKGLMAILEGREDGAVSLQGDQVVLDITAVIDQVKAGLVEKGFGAAANINIPVQDQYIVLLEAPQLAQIRTIYSFTSPVATYLVWFVLGLFIIAIVLARRRPRMAAWTGGAIAIIGLVLTVALNIGRSTFVNQLVGTPFETASEVFWATLLRFLYDAASSTIAIGIILLVIGLYLCEARWAVELRASVNNLADKVASTIPVGPITNSGVWVASNARYLRGAVFVIFAIILLIGNNLDLARTIWAAVIALILLAVIQVWVAAGRRQPEAVGV